LTVHAGDAVSGTPIPAWITPAFFLSGFAALIYQVVWQRVLFAAFGISIEAVTVVVTAFLVGLGIGSIVGGQLSRLRSRPVLLWFGSIELTIAAYGLCSVPLFRAVGSGSSGMRPLTTGVITFGLVLLPTLLMGATLPLLVSYAVRVSGNVGRSVGWLYFINTAGSSVAAIAAALIIMGRFGEMRTVWWAVAVNATVGTFVLSRHWRAPVA